MVVLKNQKMEDQNLLKRLSIIKLLYKTGLEQSKQSESISFFSILAFHDSIEMFLKLACEYKQIKSEKLSFIQFWDSLPHLTLKESMRNLNSRRVNLKHRGLIPAKIEIESSRVNTTDFFEQNTKTTFEIEFSEISLLELIKFEKVKLILTNSQKNLNEKDYENSFKKSVEAFEELLSEYKQNKVNKFTKNLFDFPSKIRINSSSRYWSNTEQVDKRLDEVVKKINEKFDHFERTLEVVSFGFNFRKYSKFKMLSPAFYITSEGNYYFHEYNDKIKFNEEDCEFGIDFVLECCLKLQEFDYENPNLETY
ncbi:MAG TPA: hypothetical protein DER05_11705 [Lutibacter sp.]|nr:hypothetical protein [Lutibacter sp.]